MTLRRRSFLGRWSLVGLGCWLLTPEARAWECSRVLDNSGTPSGAALTWPSRQVQYHFNQDGTTRLNNDTARTTVRQAFANWSSSALRDGNTSCRGLPDGIPSATDIAFLEGEPVAESFAGFNFFDAQNNHSTILFRDAEWPYPLTTPDRTERMALTTVTFNRLNGTIVDADIEFNTFGYRFTTTDTDVVWDLLNIATHEVGHFLGFAHSKVEDATMFNVASFGETQKRTLSCDDATILWFRYPAGGKSRTCGAGNLNDKCGNCAPADALRFTPEINRKRYDGGRGGCSCQSIGGADSALLATLLALCARGFRRARKRRHFHPDPQK